MLPFVDHTDRPRLRIGVISALVTAHLLAGLILGSCVRLFDYDSSEEIILLLFVGLAFAQCGLVAFWAAFGSARWWLRLVGLVIGIGYVAGGFSCAINEHDWQTYYIFGFTATVGAAGLAGFRYFRFQLALAPRDSSPAPPPQFGIRHLLVLTLLTAIVTTLALNLEMGLSVFDLLVALISLPFIAVAIAAPWAMLGQARFPLRAAVMLVVIAVAGTGSFYLLREIAFTWMLLAEAALLTATLLVLRACGYRLARALKRLPDVGKSDTVSC